MVRNQNTLKLWQLSLFKYVVLPVTTEKRSTSVRKCFKTGIVHESSLQIGWCGYYKLIYSIKLFKSQPGELSNNGAGRGEILLTKSLLDRCMKKKCVESYGPKASNWEKFSMPTWVAWTDGLYGSMIPSLKHLLW